LVNIADITNGQANRKKIITPSPKTA